jgi:hypothetical protein
MQKKNDLTECATIGALIIMRGHEPPENHPLTILKGFSTVPVEISIPCEYTEIKFLLFLRYRNQRIAENKTFCPKHAPAIYAYQKGSLLRSFSSLKKEYKNYSFASNLFIKF